jgi:hypothetical protein
MLPIEIMPSAQPTSPIGAPKILASWTKRLRREMGERLGAVSGTEGEPDVERF